MEFLSSIEQSGLGTWVRESGSLWAFPSILLFHTIGMAVVVGISFGIEMKILGFAPAFPLAPMERFFPLLWAGFWVNAVTGVLLLTADASTKLVSPVFFVKMACIVLAVITLQRIRQRVFRDPQIDQQPFSTEAKVLAATSLVFWLGAITAGRLMAYVGPVAGLY